MFVNRDYRFPADPRDELQWLVRKDWWFPRKDADNSRFGHFVNCKVTKLSAAKVSDFIQNTTVHAQECRCK